MGNKKNSHLYFKFKLFECLGWCTWCFDWLLVVLIGVLGVLVGVLAGVLGILVGVFVALIGVLVVLIGVLGVLIGVLGGFCIWDGVYVTWDGAFDIWDELSCNFITQIAVIAFIFGLNKLCSKQSLAFPVEKVHRLEKSTPTPLVRCWLISGMIWTPLNKIRQPDIVIAICVPWDSKENKTLKYQSTLQFKKHFILNSLDIIVFVAVELVVLLSVKQYICWHACH